MKLRSQDSRRYWCPVCHQVYAQFLAANGRTMQVCHVTGLRKSEAEYIQTCGICAVGIGGLIAHDRRQVPVQREGMNP